jgi:hypothetical protein
MTTNLDIIKRAMKKLHVLASGAEPTSAQAADGMTALQGLLVEVIGQGSLGRLYDVLATTDCTAMEWTRIRASAGVVVTLPTTITQAIASSWYWGWPSYVGEGPDYGWWYMDGWDCYPRPPFNLAPVVVVDSAGTETAHVYVANKGAWVTISGLAQTDVFPFSSDMENGFAAMLAERMVDDYAQELGAETKRQAVWARHALATKFGSQRRSSGSYGSYF